MGATRIPSYCWDCQKWFKRDQMSRVSYPYICIKCADQLLKRVKLEAEYEAKEECPPKFAEHGADITRKKARRRSKT